MQNNTHRLLFLIYVTETHLLFCATALLQALTATLVMFSFFFFYFKPMNHKLQQLTYANISQQEVLSSCVSPCLQFESQNKRQALHVNCTVTVHVAQRENITWNLEDGTILFIPVHMPTPRNTINSILYYLSMENI